MYEQVYNISNAFYMKVGDGVTPFTMLEVPESVKLLRFSEARRFQRCDGCQHRSGETSEVFACLYAKLPTRAVVRTTVLASHHSVGSSCMAAATLSFVEAIIVKMKTFE